MKALNKSHSASVKEDAGDFFEFISLIQQNIFFIYISSSFNSSLNSTGIPSPRIFIERGS